MSRAPQRPHTEPQQLLLDLLSAVRPVSQARVQALAPSDWTLLQSLVRQHRLGPLLRWQLRRTHAGLRLPDQLTGELEGDSRQSTLRSLLLQRELTLAQRALQGAGIGCVALKGAFLAFHAYPQPGLRPMRDLDLLVPPAQALRAYDVLLSSGWRRMAHYAGTAQGALEVTKHLPPLASACGQVCLELHVRLFDPVTARGIPLGQGDPSQEAAFWSRCVTRPMAGGALRFESPTDLLLHLVVHAALDHEFNNGPLLLADLAFLLASQRVDWPLFWTMSARCGATPASRLALALTQRYWGPQPVQPAQALDSVAEEVLDAAALLMLRERRLHLHTHLHGLITDAMPRTQRLRQVLRRVFPTRAWMAAIYPAPVDSWRLLALYYPARWWRLLTQRLPGYWRHRRDAGVRDDAARLAALHRWLDTP